MANVTINKRIGKKFFSLFLFNVQNNQDSMECGCWVFYPVGMNTLFQDVCLGREGLVKAVRKRVHRNGLNHSLYERCEPFFRSISLYGWPRWHTAWNCLRRHVKSFCAKRKIVRLRMIFRLAQKIRALSYGAWDAVGYLFLLQSFSVVACAYVSYLNVSSK